MEDEHYVVAKHEAAHVVVGLYYGVTTIEATAGDHAGLVRWGAGDRDFLQEMIYTQDHADEYAAAYLAGLAYEREAYKAHGGDFEEVLKHVQADIHNATELLGKRYFPLGAEELKERMDAAEADALEILKHNFEVFNEITDVLDKKGHIVWGEILEILEKHDMWDAGHQ